MNEDIFGRFGKKASEVLMEIIAGCCVSDHGLEYVAYAQTTEEEVEAVFAKKMAGQALSHEEIGKYKMGVLMHLGKEYHRLNWVMQLHYGVKRDNNRKIFEALGPDASSLLRQSARSSMVVQ